LKSRKQSNKQRNEIDTPYLGKLFERWGVENNSFSFFIPVVAKSVFWGRKSRGIAEEKSKSELQLDLLAVMEE